MSTAAPIKLYVGNIPLSARNYDLKELFEKFGKVAECDILKDFAFVHMDNTNDAKAAIAGLHDTLWKGARLRVELSISSKASSKGPERDAGDSRRRALPPRHRPAMSHDASERDDYYYYDTGARPVSSRRGDAAPYAASSRPLPPGVYAYDAYRGLSVPRELLRLSSDDLGHELLRASDYAETERRYGARAQGYDGGGGYRGALPPLPHYYAHSGYDATGGPPHYAAHSR